MEGGGHYGPDRALEECFAAFSDRIDGGDREALADAFDRASYCLEVMPVLDAAEVVSAVAGTGVAVGIVSDTNLAIGRHLRTYLKDTESSKTWPSQHFPMRWASTSRTHPSSKRL
ncbi:MAG: hypothetical protein Ct9H300mP12_07700 [Acidimicrobiales bacterium]|nr:MAG: hypothetical protein Ct9H300mP12_07700 [Acidimicrobiales bacterium]